MSDERVNIKADESTRERLNALKRDGETWDGLLRRAADAFENGDSGPVCSECKKPAHRWTTVDGSVVCADCSGIDPEAWG